MSIEKYRPDNPPPKDNPLELIRWLTTQPASTPDPAAPRLNNPSPPPILLPPKEGETSYLFVGGYYLPISKAEGHTLVMGSTGAGKSKLTYASIGHACATLSPGNGLVVLFDPKGDMYPLAHHFSQKQNVPLYYFNVSDSRSHAWDIAHDIGGELDILYELITILLPTAQTNDPFWIQGAQAVALAASLSLQSLVGEDWGLHDLYNACFSDLNAFIEFLTLNPTNAPVIDRILRSESTKTVSGILMQLSVSLQALHLGAVHQYHTPSQYWISLKQILTTGGIVVISQKQTSRTTTTPLMRAMFRRLSDLILELPEYPRSHTHLFIDEFAYLGKQLPGITDLLTFSRSKHCHVYLTVQSVDQLRENYGQNGAEIIASNCDFQVLMRAGSQATARWQSEQTGSERILRSSYTQTATHFSQQYAWTTEQRLIPDEFRTLPRANPRTGLHYVFISPYSGVVKTHLPAEEVSYLQPPVSPVPGRVDKPANQHSMPFWNIQDKLKTLKTYRLKRPTYSKQQFVAQASTPVEQALRSNVWELFQTMVDTGVKDYVQYHHQAPPPTPPSPQASPPPLADDDDEDWI